MISIITIVLISYVLGSIPTSIIAGKLLKGIDIRQHGSGNAGAANVFRVLGWKAGVGVGLFDLLKGLAATVLVSGITFDKIPVNHSFVQILAGMSAVIGHIWTVFAGFKGGKGVLTAAGMFLGLAPITTLVCFAVWGVIFYTTRYVSLSSITAALLFGAIMTIRKILFFDSVETPLFIFSVIVSLLVLYTHRSNVKRLIKGTENRFERKKH